MNDERLAALYRRAVAARAPHDRAGCPSPADVAALADGALPEARRLALIDHVAACAGCSADLALLRSVAAARQPADYRRLALAAAVVIAVGAALVWRAVSPGRQDDVLRGGGRRVTLIAPVGTVAAEAGRVLVWRPAEGALEYRIELGGDGSLRYSATTRDTTLTLPDSVQLGAGADYEWSVDTRLEGERVTGVGRFRVR